MRIFQVLVRLEAAQQTVDRVVGLLALGLLLCLGGLFDVHVANRVFLFSIATHIAVLSARLLGILLQELVLGHILLLETVTVTSLTTLQNFEFPIFFVFVDQILNLEPDAAFQLLVLPEAEQGLKTVI